MADYDFEVCLMTPDCRARTSLRFAGVVACGAHFSEAEKILARDWGEAPQAGGALTGIPPRQAAARATIGLPIDDGTAPPPP
jgi:hypothetical protein